MSSTQQVKYLYIVGNRQIKDTLEISEHILELSANDPSVRFSVINGDETVVNGTSKIVKTISKNRNGYTASDIVFGLLDHRLGEFPKHNITYSDANTYTEAGLNMTFTDFVKYIDVNGRKNVLDYFNDCFAREVKFNAAYIERNLGKKPTLEDKVSELQRIISKRGDFYEEASKTYYKQQVSDPEKFTLYHLPADKSIKQLMPGSRDTATRVQLYGRMSEENVYPRTIVKVNKNGTVRELETYYASSQNGRILYLEDEEAVKKNRTRAEEKEKADAQKNSANSGNITITSRNNIGKSGKDVKAENLRIRQALVASIQNDYGDSWKPYFVTSSIEKATLEALRKVKEDLESKVSRN